MIKGIGEEIFMGEKIIRTHKNTIPKRANTTLRISYMYELAFVH